MSNSVLTLFKRMVCLCLVKVGGAVRPLFFALFFCFCLSALCGTVSIDQGNVIGEGSCLFFYWQDVFLSDKKNLAFILSRDPLCIKGAGNSQLVSFLKFFIVFRSCFKRFADEI